MKRSAVNLPVLPDRFEYKLELGPTATARELKKAQRHRWFYFPHSFSPRLVFKLIDNWNLPEGSQIVDNFVGSGTMLLACRERRMNCVGFDLSPLAIKVTNTKLASYDLEELRDKLIQIITVNTKVDKPQTYFPSRITKAFTKEELQILSKLIENISKLKEPTRSFFRLAFLWTAHRFSRAIPDGGWFRWGDWPDNSEELLEAFQTNCSSMIGDVQALNWPGIDIACEARRADARRLPMLDSSTNAVITSPPYANRHDYSRIFHIDLLLMGLTKNALPNFATILSALMLKLKTRLDFSER